MSYTTTKRPKKREPTQTPPEWIDLLGEFDHALTRVRLLWRRGQGRYRPLVPLSVAVEELDHAGMEEWDELELAETHYEWAVPTHESPVEREQRLRDNAAELWAMAVAWTRAKGPVCDFQLRGYGSENEILVEDGKRCNLTGERSRYEDDPSDRSTLEDTIRNLIKDERNAWQQVDKTKDALLGRLVDERTKLFDNMDRASSAAPKIIDNLRAVLDSAMAFQQRQFDNLVDQVSHDRHIEVQAFTEMQRTQRVRAVSKIVGDGVSALIAGGLPLVHTLLDNLGRSSQGVPQFEDARDALAYLAITLRADQLVDCFTANAPPNIAQETINLLDGASLQDDEPSAVACVKKVARVLFNHPAYRKAVTPEQWIATQYIFGRIALLRYVTEEYEAGA